MGASLESDNRKLYLRLLGYVRPYWKAFALALVCMGLASIAEPLFPALMKHMLDDGFKVEPGSWDWFVYPGAIFGIFLVRAILGYAGDYAMSWVSSNVIADLRAAMFARLIRLPTSYFNDHSSGRTMSRVVYDVGGVAAAATSALTTLMKDSLSLVGLTAWMLYLNWKLTLITIAIGPFIAVAVRSFGGRLRQLARRLQTNQGAIVQVLQEAIEGNKLVKVFGGQAYESERFAKVVQEQRRLTMRSTIANAAQGPVVQLFAALALAIIMGVALHQASSSQTTVGSFVSFITAMLMTLAPMKRLTDVNAPLQRGLAAAESVFELIDEPLEDDAGARRLDGAKGEVAFENVSFRYRGADHDALSELSFSIRAGECVALVGPSGGGKSTVANLLPRFFDTTGGEIRINGIPLGEIALDSLRGNIALVSQEIVLFNDTIAANIAYGARRDASQAEIIAAARAAHAMEFIERLPERFDTMMGERGIKLSGGQRQRIAIARALLKDAPILILDEATSALDTESERQVQAALNELMVGRTTLVIAHRLSTIERADRIVVVQAGRVAESGTNDELLALDGVYAQLYRLQFAQQAVDGGVRT